VAQVTIQRLQQVPLTSNMTEDQVELLASRVEERVLSRGETLFRSGEPLPFLYYVEKGQIREEEAGAPGRQAEPRYAGPGDYLGRYALLTGEPPRVTAIAEEDSTVLAFPLRDLQPILFSAPDWRSWFFKADVAARLRAMPLFQILDDWDLYALADKVQVENVAAGQRIYRAHEEAHNLYAIDYGQVVETAPQGIGPAAEWPRYLAAGNFFGRVSLRPNERREANAVARIPSRLYNIPIDTLRNLFRARGFDLFRDLPRTDVVGRLRGVKLLSNLPESELRQLAGYVNLVYRRPGDIVSRQGEPATELQILDQGEAIVRRQIGQAQPRPVGYLKAEPVTSLPSSQTGQQESVYFGAHALLAEEIRGATVEVTEPSTWIVLARDDFLRFLDSRKLSAADLRRTARQRQEMPPPRVADVDRLDLPYYTRRHWIVAVGSVMLPAVAIAMVGAGLAADVIFPGVPPLLKSIILWAGAILLAFFIPWGIWRYANWRNDSFEVTNEAVRHIERIPFPIPRENRYEVPLIMIQNVTIDVSILGQLLGFGNLSVDTAAIQGEVDFTRTPHPARVQQLIQRAAAEARTGQEMQYRQSIREQLEDQLYPERIRPAVHPSAMNPPEPPSKRPAPPGPQLSPIQRLLPWIEKRLGDQVIWRKHWINMVRRVGLPFLSFIVTSYFVLAYVLFFLSESVLSAATPIALPPMGLIGLSGPFFFFLLFLWILAVLWVVYQYVDYWNDVYIVTDTQVIDVQRNLAIFPLWFIFTESRRQASLDKVQNVNLQIPNLLASVLGYGDVIVQTAGTEGTLDFLFVSNPRHVQAEVLRHVTAHRERERQEEFDKRWGGMAEWFEAYRQLTKSKGGDGGGSQPGTP
jgi:CRP-like cAMP-binding protein/uncharacterized membrane protein YdbT with pleckstrin-like domain